MKTQVDSQSDNTIRRWSVYWRVRSREFLNKNGYQFMVLTNNREFINKNGYQFMVLTTMGTGAHVQIDGLVLSLSSRRCPRPFFYYMTGFPRGASKRGARKWPQMGMCSEGN
jgi:hypothetical protein